MVTECCFVALSDEVLEIDLSTWTIDSVNSVNGVNRVLQVNLEAGGAVVTPIPAFLDINLLLEFLQISSVAGCLRINLKERVLSAFGGDSSVAVSGFVFRKRRATSLLNPRNLEFHCPSTFSNSKDVVSCGPSTLATRRAFWTCPLTLMTFPSLSFADFTLTPEPRSPESLVLGSWALLLSSPTDAEDGAPLIILSSDLIRELRNPVGHMPEAMIPKMFSWINSPPTATIWAV